MTFIVGTVRAEEVVLTADGRSTTTTNGAVTAVDDRYQKLYPVPDHPIVVAHMGENRLGGETVGALLGRFFARLNAGNFTIVQVADELRHFAHPLIRKRLGELSKLKNGCAFWVAGFSSQENGACWVELFWQHKEGSLHTVEKVLRPLSVVAGGDGKGQARAPQLRQVDGKPVETVCAYQRGLVKEAAEAKVTPHNTVGGHVHEVVITREKWRWTLPPATGKAGPATRAAQAG